MAVVPVGPRSGQKLGRWLRGLTIVSAVVLAAGLLELMAYVIFEWSRTPGISPVDTYWIGRLPWTGIAEGLIVSGATATAIFGYAASWTLGGWVRRVIAGIPATFIALWWVAALQPGRQAVPCNDCPPPAVDPWAYAYSMPEAALLLLLIPAVVIGLAALGSGPRR